MSEAGKKVTLIDPTVPNWHCAGTICGHELRTSDKAVWDKHFADFEHEHTGATPCKDCGEKEIAYKKTMKIQPNLNVPAYCKNCTARIAKEHAANQPDGGKTA